MLGIGPHGSSPLGSLRATAVASTIPPAPTARGGATPWVIGGIVVGGLAVAALATYLIRRTPDAHAPSPPTTPTPTPTPTPSDPATGVTELVTVGQLNAYNLFDTVDDPKKQDDVRTPEQYELHLRKLALTLRDTMGAPDIVTLQEVENEQVLRDLVARPELAGAGYVPVLREGRDPRGIDVAVLYKGARFEEAAVTTWDTDGKSASGRTQKDFTRPPLVVELAPRAGTDAAKEGAATVTAVALHLTSRLQGADGERRRGQQAGAVAGKIDELRAADPARLVVVGGDLNMAPGEPPYAALVGSADAATGVRLLTPLDAIDAAERYSYRRGSTKELLDHVLLTPTDDATVRSATISHVNTTAPKGAAADPNTPAGASDHDPVVVSLEVTR